MKYLMVFLISVFLAIGGIGYILTEPLSSLDAYDGTAAELFVEEEVAMLPPACPVTLFSDNDKCMDCHSMVMVDGKPKFGLKEIPLSNTFSEKPYGMEIIKEFFDSPPVGYVEIRGTNSGVFRQVADYLTWHPDIRKVIFELHTPGGSIMDAWRSVGIIKEMQRKGVHIEMRVYGIAASAGAILLVAGDTRLVAPNAEIMIHKVWTFSIFDIKTPDSSQDTADILKHFQDNINKFLRDRTNLTEDQLDNKIFKRDWWMTGSEAIELGIATGSM